MPDGSLLVKSVHIVDTIELAWIPPRLQRLYGWSETRALAAVTDYGIFLRIAFDFPDRPLAPPSDADKAWHEHILNTQRYVADCYRVFGYYLHHNPEIYGTDEFWSAWELSREQYAAREGVLLPSRVEVETGDTEAGGEAGRRGAEQCIVVTDGYSAAQCIRNARTATQCILNARSATQCIRSPDAVTPTQCIRIVNARSATQCIRSPDAVTPTQCILNRRGGAGAATAGGMSVEAVRNPAM